MDPITIAIAVGEAIASNQAKQNENAWMNAVVGQLTEINQKLDLLLDEVRQIKEQIARLPAQFDEILKDVEDARVLGARQAIIEIFETASVVKLSPDMLTSLSVHLTTLAAQEGLLENKWGYSSWWPIYIGFLTRAAGYKLLAAHNSAWKTQLKVALDRKIQFFEAGLSLADHASGPGKALVDRMSECKSIEDLINPCLGTTVQICYNRTHVPPPNMLDGKNYVWVIWTQSYISGGFAEKHVWMDPAPERQPVILTVADEKPQVGKVYPPVGCPEIVGEMSGSFSKEIVYNQRRVIATDMNQRIERHTLASDTISHLTPIVGGMTKALDSLRAMKSIIGS